MKEASLHFASRFAVLACLLLMPSLALSSDQKDASFKDCRTWVNSLGIVEANEKTTIDDIPDGCRLRHFYAKFSPRNRYRIDEATLVAPGLFDAIAHETPPAQLDLTLTGFKVSPEVGSRLTGYIIEMQSDPMTIHLNYRWDQKARTVDLADFSVTVGRNGGVRLAGHVSDFDFDPALTGGPDTVPGKLDRLTVTLDNGRLFTSFAAIPLIGMLTSDADPVPLIDGYKAAATAFIGGLPADKASDGSKAALKHFVADFPRPTGAYSLELTSDAGIAFNTLDDLSALARALSSTHIEASRTDKP